MKKMNKIKTVVWLTAKSLVVYSYLISCHYNVIRNIQVVCDGQQGESVDVRYQCNQSDEEEEKH